MATRQEVYAAVDSERAYQDAQLGNSKRHEGQPPMTPGEYILCIEKCLADARTAWYAPNDGTACLDFIRKVTALGVGCMELHGAPYRPVITKEVTAALATPTTFGTIKP